MFCQHPQSGYKRRQSGRKLRLSRQPAKGILANVTIQVVPTQERAELLEEAVKAAVPAVAALPAILEGAGTDLETKETRTTRTPKSTRPLRPTPDLG